MKRVTSSSVVILYILSNLFIVQINIIGSNASNCIVFEFQILFIIVNIDNSI